LQSKKDYFMRSTRIKGLERETSKRKRKKGKGKVQRRENEGM